MRHFKKTTLWSLIGAAFLLLLSSALYADAFPDGAGIVYGEGYGFNVKAPKGWTLDNSSGVSQKLNAVFYPNGSSWSGSPIVAYAQSRPKTSTIQTGDDAAKETVRHFREDGDSPNYQGTLFKALKTDAGKDATLYRFSGDKWGNQEVAAYLVEKERINFFVMSSQDKKLFEASLPAFEALVKSYLPMTVSITPPPKK
jgi:hypothetical protein